MEHPEIIGVGVDPLAPEFLEFLYSLLQKFFLFFHGEIAWQSG
jgi:hypothetical protein